MLEAMLEDLGCTVVDSVASVETGLAAVQAGGFDVALLDVNLAGQRVDPVAEALRNAGLPFAFASGYGAAGSAARGGADEPVTAKPFRMADLEMALRKALSTAGTDMPGREAWLATSLMLVDLPTGALIVLAGHRGELLAGISFRARPTATDRASPEAVGTSG